MESISIEQLCSFVRSRKAIVVRYESPRSQTVITHPENIRDGDVLLLNPYLDIIEREAYILKNEENQFCLEKVPVMFGSEDIPSIVKESLRRFGIA